MPEYHLNFWRFDSPDWLIHPRFAPLIVHNISAVESWSGYALAIGGSGPARLVFPVTATTGRLNLDAKAGALRMWFRPNWTSGALGGSGPGAPARLFELGTFSGPNALPSWSLQFDPDGSRLALVFRNGALPPLEVLAAQTPWQAGQWRQVVLTYWDQQTRLYIDGVLQAVGPGAELSAPGQARGQPGFALGSDVLGGNPAQGQFDELTTFGLVMDESAVAANYHKLKDYAALGPVSPQENAAFRAMAEAAMAKSLAQPSAPQMLMSMQPLACNEFALNIAHVPGENPTELELSVVGGRPGTLYDLLASSDLNSANDWQTWTRIDTLDFDDVRTILPTAQGSPDARFYRLAEVIDPLNLGPVNFYVSATAAPGGDGSRDLPFSSIQQALDNPNMADCSVIQVLPGVYSGPNNRNLNFGDRHIVLVSERGWEQTIIDCGSVTGSRAFVFNNGSDQPRGFVIGFTIRNARDSAVFASNESYPLFANCSFQQNTTTVSGGAVHCDDAKALFLNCRFYGNQSSGSGGALVANGDGSRVRLSHCSFSENSRANNGGTINAANGASVELINSIVWSTFTTQGNEFQITGTGASVVANYSDIRGGFAGNGNLDVNPLFEAGSTRLTVNSPVIDRGTDTTFPGCSELVRYDMDGEARLDHSAPNAVGPVDIGADEFVYRLQMPLDGNGFSIVDEASGAAFLGEVGGITKIAVVDDEVEAAAFVIRINASGLFQSFAAITVTNSPDKEGICFAPASMTEPPRVYFICSQTKRNWYLQLDNDFDPFIDPPNNDYDHQRTYLGRIGLNPTTLEWNGVVPTYWRSETRSNPDSVQFGPRDGLTAFITNQFVLAAPTNVNPFFARTYGNEVMIAFNDRKRFADPVWNVRYANGAPLDPNNPDAGTSLGDTVTPGELGNGVLTHNNTYLASWPLAVNTDYYYKIWAFVSNGNRKYTNAMVIGPIRTNRQWPRIDINEWQFGAPGDYVELYNPAGVAINLLGYKIADRGLVNDGDVFSFPANLSIPARGHLALLAIGATLPIPQGSANLPFRYSDGGDDILLYASDGTAATPGNLVAVDSELGPGFELDTIIGDGEFLDDNAGSLGRVWNGHARPGKFARTTQHPPETPGAANNNVSITKLFDATGDANPNNPIIYLTWRNIGRVPAVWDYSPKQNDFHPINVEGFAYKPAGTTPEAMIIGLRSPLISLTHSNAIYFRVNNVGQFLPATPPGWNVVPPLPASGINQGLDQLVLENQGIRAITWYPAQQTYLIIGGPPNGGPLEKEVFGGKFSLYSWDGTEGPVQQYGHVATPLKIIDDLRPYTIRPEGITIITVNGEPRVLFTEDRFRATGYASRNIIHWPISILGTTFQSE